MARADEGDAGADAICVEVVYAGGPHAVDLCAVRLVPPATVADALQASGMLQRHGLDAAAIGVGVFGSECQPERALREGDRVEIYRPLQVEPKTARRLRAQGQGPRRTAGA